MAHDGVKHPAKTAYVLQHLAFEDLGILEPILRARGYAIRAFEAGTVPEIPSNPEKDDLLVVLGGPVGVYDGAQYPFLLTEKLVVGQWIADDRPILGVCLGAQLIADELGAAVAATGRKEIGFAPLTLTPEGRASVLAPLAAGDPVPVLHWHGDQFETPAAGVRLAETPGFPNQAFAVGARVLGLQFHLEADHLRIERWLIGHAAELAAAGIDPRTIRDDAHRHGPRLAAAAREVFTGWLDGLTR